jgi:hypothetical protein
MLPYYHKKKAPGEPGAYAFFNQRSMDGGGNPDYPQALANAALFSQQP